MKKISRLPVQHPRHPHCPHCKRDLSAYDGLTLSLPGEEDGVAILAVTLRVRCTCGSEWDFTKRVKS